MRVFAIALLPILLLAQQAVAPSNSGQTNPAAYPLSANAPGTTQSAPSDDVEWVCPMDKNVREKEPGKCRICGMTLVAGIPDERPKGNAKILRQRVHESGDILARRIRYGDLDAEK